MAGGLIGDVPPAINYWTNIRNINKYNIHLILDEVLCGTCLLQKLLYNKIDCFVFSYQKLYLQVMEHFWSGR